MGRFARASDARFAAVIAWFCWEMQNAANHAVSFAVRVSMDRRLSAGGRRTLGIITYAPAAGGNLAIWHQQLGQRLHIC